MQIIMKGAAVDLPPLRHDIDIYPGGNDKYNSPTWVIHDPIAEKFYRIGWIEHEIITRWDVRSADKICELVNTESTLTITDNNIQKLLNFLKNHNLLYFEDEESAENLYATHLRIRAGRFKRLLQEYLFFRIPLVRPDNFLKKTLPYVRKFFTKKVLYVFIAFWLIGFYFVLRQWSRFTESYDYFFTAENMLVLTIVITFSKIVHELGHAYAGKYYNCKITTMGVALLVLFPVMYTDTTDSWRLKNRHHRVVIASAGIITELALAGFALFLWGFVPDGLFSSLLIYFPTVSLLTTFLVNANPLLRYDGYHILSDLLCTDNLQTRASELATWKFRSFIFGIEEPQPVICSKFDLRLYLIYAYAMWIYRFFLYLSICLIVYYYFFKLLGIFLMLVEVYLFLVMPVVKELHTSIAKLYELKKLPKRTIVSLTIAILAIIFLFIPWQSRIEIPAVIGYKNDSKIYVQHAGQIESVNIKTGAKVIKDQILVTLHSPEIDHQMAKVKNELEILETKLRQESGLGKKLGEKQVSVAELAEKKSEYNNLLAESTKLIIKAPHDGEITNISKSAKLDTWLKDEDYLLSLSDIKSKVIIGYIMEQDLNRLPQDISNLQGKIYFNKIVTKPYTIKVVRIDNARNKYLENPYFASTHGGDLLVFANNTKSNKRSSHGEEYILNDAVYRVLAEPLYPEDILPDYAVRGKMHIYGERSSIASRSIRYVLAVLLRESGF